MQPPIAPDHHQANIVSMLAGLFTLVTDGGKVITAFFVAVATGAGYRLGVWLFGVLKDKTTSLRLAKGYDKNSSSDNKDRRGPPV